MEFAAAAPPVERLRRRGRGRQLAASTASCLLVVASAALLLRVADALPGAALGLPRGVQRLDAMADLERVAGRRMPVPAYYPHTIEWPPSERRYYAPGSAAMWCRQTSGGGLALVVAIAPARAGRVAPQVLPWSSELQREDGIIRGRPAVLTRLLDADGAIWQQIEWRGRDEVVLVRYRGTLDELMSIAGSMFE